MDVSDDNWKTLRGLACDEESSVDLRYEVRAQTSPLPLIPEGSFFVLDSGDPSEEGSKHHVFSRERVPAFTVSQSVTASGRALSSSTRASSSWR